MPQTLINIDVPDLPKAEAFYTGVFGLTVRRRFGSGGVELTGGGSPIFLLVKKEGTVAASSMQQTRSYARHWTPVHLDFVVEDCDAIVAKAVAAGANVEDPAESHQWGRIAHLADPFGHGICILQMLNRGYDEIASFSSP